MLGCKELIHVGHGQAPVRIAFDPIDLFLPYATRRPLISMASLCPPGSTWR